MNIAEMFEKNESPPPNILIYGEVGSGKTVLALTLGKRAQVIDCDLGLRSGANVDDLFTTDRRAVDVKQFRETAMPARANAWEKLKLCVFDIATQCNQGRYPYDAVILDSLTRFTQMSMNYVLSNANKIGKPPEQSHWGMSFNEIHMVLGVLVGLPIPLIVIAHETIKTFGSGKDAEDRIILAIKGKNMPPDVMSMFDEVWYMRHRRLAGGKQSYVIQTLGTSALVARSRACLPDMTNTDIGMWKLLEKMGYTKESKTDKLTPTTTPQKLSITTT